MLLTAVFYFAHSSAVGSSIANYHTALKRNLSVGMYWQVKLTCPRSRSLSGSASSILKPFAAAAAPSRTGRSARRSQLIPLFEKKIIMCISTIWVAREMTRSDQLGRVEVPCGKCYECVKRRRNDWYIRCLIESRNRKFTYFGLLTYAEVNSKLKKRDIQLFLKRLRSYEIDLRYFIVGEYGDEKGRPHWHCLFFSDKPIPFNLIAKAWRGGYSQEGGNISGWIRFEPIKSPRSIRYTVKYMYKYVGNDQKFEFLVSKNPAIGKSFLNKQILFLTKKSVDFTVDGRKVAMPRYYKRKFFDDYPDIKDEINEKLAAKVAEINSRELEIGRSLYPNMTDRQVLKKIKLSKHEHNEQFQRGKYYRGDNENSS